MHPTIQSVAAFAFIATTLTFSAAAQTGQHANHHPETTNEPSLELAEGLARGVGSIVKIYVDERALKLTHAPIESLGWPSMTMKFGVSSELEIHDFAPGDTIEFDFDPSQASGFEIKALRKASSKAAVESLKNAEPADAKTHDGHGAH